MAYQTADYTPPTLPEISTSFKNFDDIRLAVGRITDYLQRQQANNVLYFQHLRENQNQAATTEGPDIPSAATITVTKFMHVITGGSPITTIIAPRHFVGQLMLVAQDGFVLVTGGNIASGTAVPAGTYVMLVWVSSRQLWYIR